MSLNLGAKALAGAIALAIGGAAMASTSLDATAPGDVLLNIVNESANSVASAATNSAFLSGNGTVDGLSGSPAFWGGIAAEGEPSNGVFDLGGPPYGHSTAPGTAMSFYQVHVNGSAVLGTGDLNGSVATFGGAGVGTGTSPVPLPTPLLLLLSGLGLMGVVARRGKPSADLASGRSGGPTSGESAYGQITPGLDTQEIVTETPSFNAAAR